MADSKAANQTVVLKADDKLKEKLIEFYKDDFLQKVPQYASFQAKCDDCVVTLYQSGKLMFQGKRAEEESRIWTGLGADQVPAKKAGAATAARPTAGKTAGVTGMEDPAFCDDTSFGSDEVGTGDFFGPVVVTASFVRREQFDFLLGLGVRDSKKLTDKKMLEIGPALAEAIPHVTKILSNREYNAMRDQGINMNQIKAILHNECLTACIKGAGFLPDMAEGGRPQVVVDQFEPPKAYYNHLAGQKERVGDITFMTKAEDQCLAVAASSILSRVAFLREMDRLRRDYDLFDAIPFGAGAGVDGYGAALVEEKGWEILTDLAKLNFENVNKIKQLL